jgi:hypothetical protein
MGHDGPDGAVARAAFQQAQTFETPNVVVGTLLGKIEVVRDLLEGRQHTLVGSGEAPDEVENLGLAGCGGEPISSHLTIGPEVRRMKNVGEERISRPVS